MVVLIDFDGTCVTREFPSIGKDVGAIPVLKDLVESGHKLILYTVRHDKYLDEAINWLSDRGVRLHGINQNPKYLDGSPKPYADLIIDDTALGTPLILPGEGVPSKYPYVDWERVREFLEINGWLEFGY